MTDAVIQSAIEGRLKAWAQAQTPPISIAFQNTSYTPVTGQRYMRGFLMPANTLNPSQGGEHKHYHGMYQVSVYTAEGTGTGEASSITKAITELFKCPTTIPKNGLNVRINRTPATAQGMSDGDGFWMVPVTIWYSLDDFT